MAKPEPDLIGPLLKAARQEARVSRRDVAELVGISVGHLSNIESGRRNLTPHLHRQILAALAAHGVETTSLPQAPGEPS